jgi:hypothetical protein
VRAGSTGSTPGVVAGGEGLGMDIVFGLGVSTVIEMAVGAGEGAGCVPSGMTAVVGPGPAPFSGL